jgi:hypothetical protein
VLRHSDYESFIGRKSLTHPELAELADVSKNKIRQVLLRMLVEAGLLCDGSALGIIQRPVLSDSALSAIVDDSGHWLAGFLFPDNEIRSL